MKKAGRAAVLLCAAILLTGCGKEESTALKDVPVEKYVTLGDYTNLGVQYPEIEISEEECKELADQTYYSVFPAEKGITDRPVWVGDTANIDFEGKKDDVAFAGGTAAGYCLTIGSGQFIDGFEDGLVGVTPGETVDLNLTFPENYDNAELAGADVVFTVTVNFIIPVERDPEVIALIGIDGVSDEASLLQYFREYILSYKRSQYESTVENDVIDAAMASCTFAKMPEYLVKHYEETMRENITSTAEMYGMDADTFTTYYYGQPMEEFVTSYATESLKQNMMMQAIANAEGLTMSDEELNETLLGYATGAGYATVEDYIGDTSIEDYREYFMYENVMNYLMGFVPVPQ